MYDTIITIIIQTVQRLEMTSVTVFGRITSVAMWLFLSYLLQTIYSEPMLFVLHLHCFLVPTEGGHIMDHSTLVRVGWLVGWSLTCLFSTNMAISETKGQGWTVILLPSEGRLAIY